jgi:glutathione S-transferase
MSQLTLVIGNKNYSSWSLRPWLFLKYIGVPFDEVRIPLYTQEMEEALAPYSPSGKVPVLLEGELRVWESLAICEYLAERFPQARGWPEERGARALARSVAAEMHAGFATLRSELPMNCRARRAGVVPSAAAQADIERVITLWCTCRESFGSGGPWLFGAFGIADAMFAPGALRFHTYGIALPEAARAYAETVRAHPAVVEWVQAARRETEVIERFERGTPVAARADA